MMKRPKEIKLQAWQHELGLALGWGPGCSFPWGSGLAESEAVRLLQPECLGGHCLSPSSCHRSWLSANVHLGR